MTRIGHGYDVHRFEDGRRLVLGGVTIEKARGLAGHSDADVLVHAIASALLGSLALGDLGTHFPDTDPRYKDISSLELLRSVYAQVRVRGYVLVNCDTTLVAEEPRLSEFISDMRKNLASALETTAEQISVKATTSEGLGPIGRAEAIAAYAVVLVDKL